MQMFNVDSVQVRYLERPEAKGLVEACPGPLRSVVLVALNTGMRRGEFVKLRWQDVSFSERFATVRENKGKRNQHLPLNQSVIKVLRRLNGRKSGDYVFPGDRPGDHLSESYVTRWFRRVAIKADTGNLRFHDLRHAFASWLVMGGTNLATVQQLMGHQTYQMTLKHAHRSPEHRRAAVDNLAGQTEFLDIKSPGHGTNLAQEENSQNLKNAVILT